MKIEMIKEKSKFEWDEMNEDWQDIVHRFLILDNKLIYSIDGEELGELLHKIKAKLYNFEIWFSKLDEYMDIKYLLMEANTRIQELEAKDEDKRN